MMRLVLSTPYSPLYGLRRFVIESLTLMTSAIPAKRHPWFAAFFAFGAIMCTLTTGLLLFPGTPLDSLWRLNPDAHLAFQSFGNWSVALMVTVGIGCAFAAIGLWQGTLFGVRLALIILSLNIIGDLFNALVRHDYRALIGLPIGGAMIFYLAKDCKRRLARI
jgi:hypothetical protein